jgi:hypothetical protein
VITGTGTANTLAKFTDTEIVGDSSITDTGSLITVASGAPVNILNASDVGLGGASGALRIGNTAAEHMAFDTNEIMVKSDATTAGNLYLQNDGGAVLIGNATAASFNMNTGGFVISSSSIVTAGTWQGTAVAMQYGGTGLDLSAMAQGSVLVCNAPGVLSVKAGVSDGYVLTYTLGTDQVEWLAPTTGVGGSGTIGYVPYFSASTTLANSQLRRDAVDEMFFEDVDVVTIDSVDATNVHLKLYSFLNGPGGSNFIDGFAASVKDAPTGISYNNQVMLGLSGFGHTGSGYGEGGRIQIRCAANWSASVFTTDIGFYTREGSGTLTERWTIEPGGDLLPFADSTVAIGSSALRMTVVYADSFDGPGGSITGISASNITSGVLGVTYGGTGQDWSAAAKGGVIWTDGVGSFAITNGVTDGDVLTYTSGTDSVGWATPAAGMGGSGTTTYIPYFSASTTLADSPMYRSSPTLVKTDSDLYVYGPAPDTGGVTSSVIVFAYAGAPAFSGYHSGGTRGSETASSSGNWVGLFRGIAHDGTTYSNAAAVLALTEETWGGSAHAAGLRFYTRATGDGDYVARWVMDQTGHFRPYSESPALNIGSTSTGIATLHFYDITADRVLMRYGSTEIMRMEYGGAAGQQGLLIGSRQNSTAITSGEGSWTSLIANVEIGQDEVLRVYSDSNVEIATRLQTAWGDRETWRFTNNNPGRMYFPVDSGIVSTGYLYASSTVTLNYSHTFRAGTLNADDIGAGTVTYAYGGTGQTSWTKGDLLYADATNSLSKLGVGGVSDGDVLTYDSGLGLPNWEALPSGITGSGTTGWIPYWTTGGTVLGDSPLERGTATLVKGDIDFETYGPAAGVGGVDSTTRMYAYGTGITPIYRFLQARGFRGSESATAGSDIIGQIQAHGYDGSAYQEGARISFVSVGTWSGTDRTTLMSFYTRNTSGALTEQWRISPTGVLYPVAAEDIGSTTNRCSVIYVNEINADASGATDPSYMFNGATTTGMYYISGPGLGFTTSGVGRVEVSSTAMYPVTTGYDLGTTSLKFDAYLQNALVYGQSYPGGGCYVLSNQTGTLNLNWNNGQVQIVTIGTSALTINPDNSSNMNEGGTYSLMVHGPASGSQNLTIGNVDNWVGTSYASATSISNGDVVTFTFIKQRNRGDTSDLVEAIVRLDNVAAGVP